MSDIMGVQETGLTLEGLAHQLETLTEKLGGLERENERMRSENAELRSKVATLEGSNTRRNEIAALRGSGTPRDDEEPVPALDGRVSRRRLLSKAGAAAAGLVVAGALTQRDIREAKAASPAESFESNSASVPAVEASNTGGGAGVVGDAGPSGSAGRGAVEGSNNSDSGYGVWGNARVGVYGSGHTGVLGENPFTFANNQGSGVQGSHNTNGPGVLGNSQGGWGVMGTSFGGSTGAVYGKHLGTGYGGLFEGGRAQLRLVPKGSTGRPTTGAHSKGEIYMDLAGALFVCVRGGSPGTWRKVTTSAV